MSPAMRPTTTPALSRINSIECLRGISALLVVCYHYREFLNDITPKLGHMLFENGRIGVDIFFVLSGFAIYLSTQAPSEHGVLRFLLRRFFRIVPLAWLLMAVVWLITPGLSAMATLKSVFFIPLSPASAPFFGYNILPVAWTLTYELCFYGIFALALWVAPRQRGLVVVALVLSMVGLLQWHSGQGMTIDPYREGIFETLHLGPIWVGIFANPLFFEFLFGVLLAWIYIRHAPTLTKIPVPVRTAVYLFLLAFFVSHFFSGHATGHGLGRKGLAAIALFTLYLAMHIDPLLAWFNQRFAPGPGGIFEFFGKISFSLYLVHGVLPLNIGQIPVLNHLYEQSGGWGKFILLLSFSVWAAYVLHVLVEQPCQKMGKYLTRNRPPIPKADTQSVDLAYASGTGTHRQTMAR